jgi:hypothetical protein
LFTTKVAKASPSTSSEIINKDFPPCAIGSRTGIILSLKRFFLYQKMYGFSNSATFSQD